MKLTNEEKQNMFKQAHAIARRTRHLVGDYMIAFKLALKNLWLRKKFMQAESKLIKQNKLFTNEDWNIKLSKEGRKFSANSADFRMSESIVDNYYWKIVSLSYSAEMYLVFCSFFGESVVNDWLGI